MNKSVLARVVGLIAVVLTLLLLAKFTSLGNYFSVTSLQKLTQDAGSLGLLLYFVVFLIGTLRSVPGAVFLVFAFLTYGYFKGIIISFVAAQSCAMINFYFARFVGGGALSEIKNRRVKQLLQNVELHPIRTLFWLRFFLLLSPVVNYALALTNINARKFFVANAVAMLFPYLVIISGTVLVRSPFFQQEVLLWFKSWFSV